MPLIQIVEENRVEIWDTNGYSNVQALFKKYIKEESVNRGVIINKHWLNMMNHKDYNFHLTQDAYKKALKQWEKFLNKTTYQWYIKNILNGAKVECETIII